MTHYKTIYKCSQCGATSYQPVIGRDASGTLMPTGRYRCTGCRVTFADAKEWWGHPGATTTAPVHANPHAGTSPGS